MQKIVDARHSNHYSTLLCPKCKDEYLHQNEIEVFNRDKEDSPTGTHVTVLPAGEVNINTKGGMQKNPSARRQGVLIHFRCEQCGPGMQLAIYQHKGNTFLEWKNE